MSNMENENLINPEQGEQGEAKKPGKILKVVVSLVLVLALVLAMTVVIFRDELLPGHWFSSLPGTIREDGNPNDVTCRGTYTASLFNMRRNRDTVVAEIGDMQLTNGQLLVLYDVAKDNFVTNMVGNASVNLDTSQPLDRQTCSLDESMTWQQYFLQDALKQWCLFVILNQKAQDENMTLPIEDEERLEGLYEDFYKNYVETGRFPSVDAVIQDVAGAGSTFADYQTYKELSVVATHVFDYMLENQEVTEEDIEAFYVEQQDFLTENGYGKDKDDYYVDVRHVLVTPKSAINKEEHLDENDWKRTMEYTQKLLDDWVAAGAKEEDFAKMAELNSEDPGSNKNGGLYTGVKDGDMTKNFNDWCFDETRKTGDYDIVETEHGYHIMYFVGREAAWHRICRINVPNWLVSMELEAQVEALPLVIHYDRIGIWEYAYSK